MSLDGSRFEEVTGFVYEVPALTEEGLRGMVKSYEKMRWWPPMDGGKVEDA